MKFEERQEDRLKARSRGPFLFRSARHLSARSRLGSGIALLGHLQILAGRDGTRLASRLRSRRSLCSKSLMAILAILDVNTVFANRAPPRRNWKRHYAHAAT